jgi:transposase
MSRQNNILQLSRLLFTVQLLDSREPPSSDGLKKPSRVTSRREASGRPSGGQKGHQGETLLQVAEPDKVVDHFPASNATCGSAMTLAMTTGHSARQVFDLPEPAPLLVTEHRAHDCRCPDCGAHTRSSFPDGVNAPQHRRLRGLRHQP